MSEVLEVRDHGYSVPKNLDYPHRRWLRNKYTYSVGLCRGPDWVGRFCTWVGYWDMDDG